MMTSSRLHRALTACILLIVQSLPSPSKERSFRFVGAALESAVQCGGCVVETIESGQNVSSGGMEVHVAVDVAGEVVRFGNRIECGECRGGSVYAVDGDRSVQCDERAGLALQEHVVEAQDCWPVGGIEGGCSGVQRGDCRLELKGSTALQRVCSRQFGEAASDHRLVPLSPVLVGEQDRAAMAVETAGSSGIGQQQQRMESCDFRIGRHELAQELRGPYRLFAEISSDERRVRCAGVALGEDRRDHLAHGTDALGERVQIWWIEGNSCGPDLRLGAGESTRHRLLGHQKGTGDLWRREPRDDP